MRLNGRNQRAHTHMNWLPCENPMALNPFTNRSSFDSCSQTIRTWSLTFVRNCPYREKKGSHKHQHSLPSLPCPPPTCLFVRLAKKRGRLTTYTLKTERFASDNTPRISEKATYARCRILLCALANHQAHHVRICTKHLFYHGFDGAHAHVIATVISCPCLHFDR